MHRNNDKPQKQVGSVPHHRTNQSITSICAARSQPSCTLITQDDLETQWIVFHSSARISPHNRSAKEMLKTQVDAQRLRLCRVFSSCPLPPSTSSLQQHAPPPPYAPQGRKNGEGGEETGQGERDEPRRVTGQGRPRSPKTVQSAEGEQGKEKRERTIVVVRSPCQENYPADAHPSALKSVLESANPRMDSGCASGCTWSTARATARLRDSRPWSSQTGQVIQGPRSHNQNTFGPTEGQNEQWQEANRRRQRQTIRYRGLVPPPPPPPAACMVCLVEPSGELPIRGRCFQSR